MGTFVLYYPPSITVEFAQQVKAQVAGDLARGEIVALVEPFRLELLAEPTVSITTNAKDRK